MPEGDTSYIGRRRFLTRGAKAAAGTLAVGYFGSKAYENRTFGPDFDISPQTADLLKPNAAELKKYIKAGKFDPVRVIGGGSDGSPSQPSVNLDAISLALTYLSYLDGGISEVDRVSAYVKKQGLEINQMRKEDIAKEFENRIWGGSVRHPIYPEYPIILEVNPIVLPHWNSELNGVVFHELYHVVQGGRRSENMRAAVSTADDMKNFTLSLVPLVAAGQAAEMGTVAYLNSKKNRLTNRREFIEAATAGAAAIPVYFIAKDASEYVDRFDPEEWQALKQAGRAEAIPGALTSRRCFDELRGKLFFYDKIAS